MIKRWTERNRQRLLYAPSLDESKDHRIRTAEAKCRESRVEGTFSTQLPTLECYSTNVHRVLMNTR